MNAKLKRQLRAGYLVFASLAFIKIIEYLITKRISSGGWPYLTILAFVSAGLIIYYYKHIQQLWRTEGTDNGK